MRRFPILVDIRGKLAVIVGGGAVARRKCLSLLDAGAAVTIISPELAPDLMDLVSERRIDHLAREYRLGDLKNAFLVFAATGNREVNLAVAAEASAAGILVNVVDYPEHGSFTSPAVVSRGDLLLSVSTGGKSPALSGKIRRDLEARFGEEFDPALQLLASIREKLLTEKRTGKYNKKLFDALLAHDLPGLIRTGSFNEIDRLLREIFGPEFTLDKLGAKIKDHE
ncbi:MAG TPA: bifunctional precorrin-2 dehydrogenase/sirohydrochlorin ferrochelatase [Geobacteraceae bacterium]|nr:bifunctional precorrin-2 dehydrogenase/sirohydrochlorin ferrochelatase [Geobacteraceae bacterium]